MNSMMNGEGSGATMIFFSMALEIWEAGRARERCQTDANRTDACLYYIISSINLMSMSAI